MFWNLLQNILIIFTITDGILCYRQAMHYHQLYTVIMPVMTVL